MIEDPERTAHNGGGKSSNRYVIACANKLQDQALPKGREESKERSEETTVYIQHLHIRKVTILKKDLYHRTCG